MPISSSLLVARIRNFRALLVLKINSHFRIQFLPRDFNFGAFIRKHLSTDVFIVLAFARFKGSTVYCEVSPWNHPKVP